MFRFSLIAEAVGDWESVNSQLRLSWTILVWVYMQVGTNWTS